MKTRTLVVLAYILAAAPPSWAQAPAPSSFDSAGVTIQYLDKGRGAPVVLLHGFTGFVSGVTSNGQDGSSLSAAEIKAASDALFARNDADALAACARAMTTLFEIPKDRLRAVSMPMLAIVGDHDVSNVDGVKQLETVVRGLEVVELPGANHATSVRPSAAPMVAFLNAHRD